MKTKVGFSYYLHDDYNSMEFKEWLEEQTGREISWELIEKIGRPFYEVTLDCELDVETGEVRLLKVKL